MLSHVAHKPTLPHRHKRQNSLKARLPAGKLKMMIDAECAEMFSCRKR
jgi:hypothetical protein